MLFSVINFSGELVFGRIDGSGCEFTGDSLDENSNEKS